MALARATSVLALLGCLGLLPPPPPPLSLSLPLLDQLRRTLRCGRAASAASSVTGRPSSESSHTSTSPLSERTMRSDTTGAGAGGTGSPKSIGCVLSRWVASWKNRAPALGNVRGQNLQRNVATLGAAEEDASYSDLNVFISSTTGS